MSRAQPVGAFLRVARPTRKKMPRGSKPERWRDLTKEQQDTLLRIAKGCEAFRVGEWGIDRSGGLFTDELIGLGVIRLKRDGRNRFVRIARAWADELRWLEDL